MYFSKVSLNRWTKDIDLKGLDGECIDGATIMKWYGEIKLPKQGAEYSMGCDFFAPYPINILPHNTVKIPTGIRWVCDKPEDKNYGLLLVPRSGLGCKYGLRLKNSVGVIDATYFLSESNEGHIMAVLYNPSEEVISIPQGKAFMQGIVTNYIIPEGASTDVQRNGGFGSTDCPSK